jgi:hypothetical protein
LVKIGYFCSAGYTETGGLDAVLRRVAPDVTWERCFPAVDKPAPKIGRPLPTPVAAHSGVTGEALVKRIIDHFDDYDALPYDAILIVDDADCRFCGLADDPAPGWRDAVVARLRGARRWVDRPVFVLFASPEVEAWLLADWNNTFARYYPDVQVWMRRRLLALGLDDLERYGCPRRGSSCTRKLSEDLVAAIDVVDGATDPPPGPVPRYSKRTDGPWMLRCVDPDVVAAACAWLFAPSLWALRRWVGEAAGGA